MASWLIWEITVTIAPPHTPVGVIDATFGQLIVINCARLYSYTQTHKRALSLKTVQIIDLNWILPLLPLTVATFIQVPSVVLLLSLDLQFVTAGQAENTLLLWYNHSLWETAVVLSFGAGRTLIIPLVCYSHCADVSKSGTIVTLFLTQCAYVIAFFYSLSESMQMKTFTALCTHFVIWKVMVQLWCLSFWVDFI